jgi:hypothetical protein
MPLSITAATGCVSGVPKVTVYDSSGRVKMCLPPSPPPAPVIWGSITGTVTNQTDLINYLDLNYYPLNSNPAGYVPDTRTLTINGTSYDLSADRSWTIPAGGTVTSVELAAGTGISLSGTNPITVSGIITVTNDAPDQVVSLSTTGTGLSVTGTYPSFTLENTLPDQTVVLTAGTGIDITGTYPSFTIDNTGLTSVPDLQQVTDVGATTTNNITVDAGGGTNTTIADYQINITDGTNRVRIGTDYVIIRSNGLYDAAFASTNLTAGALTLEVPDKTGTYTIATTDQLGLQNAISIDPVLTTNNSINGGNFSLDFTNIYKFEVTAEQRARFQVNNGTDSANMYASPIDGATYLDYIKGGTQQTFISLLGDQLRVGTPDVLTKSAGDVLTLVNPATGEVEFQTPTGGGGGLSYGVASGTNTYAVTISGVTGYVDGDAYIIKFTNGNDADSTININGLGAKTLVKQFDIQLTGGDIVSGQQFIIMYDGTNFQTLGVAPNQFFAYVTNDDSVTINKGQPVYAFGAAGNRMSVKLAANTSDATSAQTVGLVFSTSIAPNQRGFVITQGVLLGVNTAAYNPGDQLYLGATAGTLTKIKPFAPNHLVYIGIVERANAGGGQIYVKPQNGYEMNEIHDVQSNGAVNKDILYRDTTVTPNLWKPASIPTILGYTPVPDSRTLTINGTSYDLTADRSWTIAGGGGSATIGATVDGSGGVITAGIKGYVQIPYACTITSWGIITNTTASGTITFDIYRAASPTIPTASIVGAGTKPSLTSFGSTQTTASSSLGSWTSTSISANDILAFNVESGATTFSWAILQLFVTKL